MISLSDLDAMNRQELAAIWPQFMGGDVPPKMSQPMQRRFLAFVLQAQIEGGLSSALIARLGRIAAGKVRKETPGLRPGARLLRAWNGTTHVVDVLADGFQWNGARHTSLSAIARAITGARWSGPRFFGLTGAAGPDAAKSAPKKEMRKTSRIAEPVSQLVAPTVDSRRAE